MEIRALGSRQTSIHSAPAVRTNITVDATRPSTFPTGLLAYWTAAGDLLVDWSSAFAEDVAEQKLQFHVALGSAANIGNWDLAEWINMGMGVFSHLFTDGQISGGFENNKNNNTYDRNITTFYVGVRAINAAGLSSVVTSVVQ